MSERKQLKKQQDKQKEACIGLRASQTNFINEGMSVGFYNRSLSRAITYDFPVNWMVHLDHFAVSQYSDPKLWLYQMGLKGNKGKLLSVLVAVLSLSHDGKLSSLVKCYRQVYNDSPHLAVPFYVGRRIVARCKGTHMYAPRKDEYEIDIQFNGELRANQQEIVNKSLVYLRESSTLLLNCSTGVGKTLMSVYLTCKLRRPTLIIMNSVGLCKQWKKEFTKFTSCVPSLDLDGSDVCIVTVQSLLQNTNDDLLRYYEVVILDEVDRLCSPKYFRMVLRTYPNKLIGCSATIKKENGMERMLWLLFGKDTIIEYRTQKSADVVRVNYNSSIRPISNGQSMLLTQCESCDRNNVRPCKSHANLFNMISSLAFSRASKFRCKDHIALYKSFRAKTSSCSSCIFWEYCDEHQDEFNLIDTGATTCSKCNYIRGKFPLSNRPYEALIDYHGLTEALVHDSARNKLIASLAQKEVADGNKVMIVTLRVDHANLLAALLSNMPKDEENTISVAIYHSTMKSFSNADVLIGTGGKMGVGMDEANLCVDFDGKLSKALILAHSIKSKNKIEQVVGRLRADGVTIYDIVDTLIGSEIMIRHWNMRKSVYKKLNFALCNQ